MKINFTQEEKDALTGIINEYQSVDHEYYEIKKRFEEVSGRMKELDERSKTLMDELGEKYGEFTLQDISDSIF